MAEMTSSSVTGARLESKYVHAVYERTAERLAQFQHRAWPRVQEFIDSLEPYSLLADVGCGNGRYLEVNESVCKIGCDYSSELVQVAKGRGREVLVCDNMALPLRDSCCDAVISIAVIHHFSSNERRVQAIRELARVTRPGGRIMIYVWAFEQKHRKFKCQDVLVPWRLKEKKAKWRKDLVDSDTISNSSSEMLPSMDLSSETGLPNSISIKEPHVNGLKEESQKFSLFKVLHKLLPSSKLQQEKGSTETVPPRKQSEDSQLISTVDSADKKLNNFSSSDHKSKLNVNNVNLLTSEENEEKNSSIIKWLGDKLGSIGKKKDESTSNNFASTVSEKDLMYKQLVSNIMSGTAEIGQDCDIMNGFEVREFPGSSVPLSVCDQVVAVEIPETDGSSIQCKDKSNCDNVDACACQCNISMATEPRVPSMSLNSVQCFANEDADASMLATNCDPMQEPDEDWASIARGAIKNLEDKLMASALQNGVDTLPPNGIFGNDTVHEVPSNNSLPLSPGIWESRAECSRNSSATSLDSHDLALSDAEDMLDNVFSDLIATDNGYTSDLGTSSGEPSTCRSDVQHPAGLTWNCSDSGTYDCMESLQAVSDTHVLLNGHLSSAGSYVEVGGESALSVSVGQLNGHCSGDHERLSSQKPDVQEISDDLCQPSSISQHIASENSDVLHIAQLLGEDNGTNDTLLKRFYHVFREGELMQLITNNVSCLQVIDCFYDHANWCVIAEKH